MQSLLGVLYLGVGVVGPGEISRGVWCPETEGGDRFHPLCIYNQRGTDLSVPPEVGLSLVSIV